MWKSLRIFAVLAFLFVAVTSVIAQESSAIEEPKAPQSVVFKPRLGLGAGMFTFYGDVTNDQKTNNPISSRLGYELRVSQYVTNYLDVNFHVLFGKIGANEKNIDRNLNFESTVRMGGINLSYNFANFLKEEHIIEPYILTGFESFEFLSKTDLRDEFGSTYHYWSDGRIMNMAEDDPEADKAKVLNRDYVYESDIRELNQDGFGKYPERSFAIPIGVGAEMILSPKMHFKIGTTMYLTLSDMIDGVSDKSIGVRKGDSKNDKFLYTSFSLNYNIFGSGEKSDLEDDFNNVDFLAFTKQDTDGDGVLDFADKCPGTPSEAQVDEFGCPLDGDGDGVADYMDDELTTAAGVPVNERGVTLTDDDLFAIYAQSSDSLNKGKIVEHQSFSEQRKKGKNYVVQLGQYVGEVPPDIANILLSIPDLKTVTKGDTTMFTVGNFNDLPSAVRRRLQMVENGLPGEFKIIEETGEGTYANVSKSDVEGAEQEVKNQNAAKGTGNFQDIANAGAIPNEEKASGKTVYRVQVGAFSRKMSSNIFEGVPNLVVVMGEDGIARYYSGAYDNFKDAAGARVDLIEKGFNGAFVAPFKGGQKISLAEAGGATTAKEPKKPKGSTTKPADPQFSMNKGKVKFKVQLGIYKSQIPTDRLEIFMALGNVEQRKTQEGSTKYIVGNFDSYEEAKKYKEEIIKQGIGDAFVVGQFNDQLIPASEAVELQKQ